MKNNFQKVMVTGLASIVCAGSMSIATLPNYSNLNSVDAVYAATIKDTAMTATGTVNSNVFLRKGPGTSYGKITILTKGSKVDIVAKSSNGWYKIKYKNSYGYSYKDYITVKDSDVTTTETEYTSTGTTTTSLNVRKSPSASATKLGTLGKNAKVDIVAKVSNGWYKIKYNGGYGYISGSYVKTSTTQEETTETAYTATGTTKNSLNVRKGAGTSYDKLGSLKKGAKVDIVAKTSNGWYKIKYNKDFGYVSGSYVTIGSSTPTTPTTGETEYTATGTPKYNLKVRAAASTSSKQIGSVKKGAKVEIVAKTTNNAWYKIKYNNGYGYIAAQYVTVGSSTPTTPTTGETAYTATGTPNYNLKVRAAASTSSKQIGSVKKGAKVEIVAKTTNNAWYKIKYNKGYGYVAAQYVTVKSTTDTPTTPEVKYPATGVAVHAVFIRESANTKSKEVGVLYTNDTITVLGKATDGWYKVQYKDKDGNTDKVGYVYGDYLTIK